MALTRPQMSARDSGDPRDFGGPLYAVNSEKRMGGAPNLSEADMRRRQAEQDAAALAAQQPSLQSQQAAAGLQRTQYGSQPNTPVDTYGVGSAQIGGGQATQEANEELRRMAFEAQLKQQSVAQQQSAAEAAFQKKMGIFSSTGATEPRVGYDASGDEASARAAAFAREKDMIGSMGRGAVNSLANLMSERGTVGGGYEQKGLADIVGGTQGQLGDVVREQTIQDLDYARQKAQSRYQGGIAQRGQDIQSKQALLSLINSGSLY